MILPSTGDGITRVVVARPGQTEGATDLVVLDVDTAGGPAVERLLAENVATTPQGGCPFATAGCLGTDARGRLLVFSGVSIGGSGADMARIDPLTGDRTELGLVSFFTLSPSGQRLLVFPPGADAEPILYEADDSAVPVDARNGGEFADDALYYITSQKEGMRLQPGGTPERLATGVDLFRPKTVDGGVIMLIRRPTADGTLAPFALLDPVTLQETPSPFGTQPFDLSPDGRWVVTTDFQTGVMTFADLRTGAQDMFDPMLSPNGLPYEWRPGHLEMWLANGPITWIKTPGVAPVQVPRAAAPLSNNDTDRWSMFTADGAYWFSVGDGATAASTMIGSADDPTGPRFILTPVGGNGAFWQTQDGQIVADVWTSTPEADNFYVVDPTTGDRRATGERGVVVGIGQTRLVVNQHLVDHGGDLTVFDLDSSQPTVLAPEFATAAVVEPHGADKVAPGAAIAFQFQARFPSPYDGIWLATVP